MRRQAGEGLVDDRARHALALRVAPRMATRKALKSPATWRGERGSSEERQDEGGGGGRVPHPRMLTRKTPIVTLPAKADV